MNRLKGMRAYLAGAMDRVKDGGVGWRREIGNWLRMRGVSVLDPCDKPIDIGIEDLENREKRARWKKIGNFAGLRADMKVIRGVDLRMVDMADFLVINLDLEVHACGTYEELFLANREMKPVILRIEQGKRSAPDWLFGTLPHELFFDTWVQVHQYLTHIDQGKNVAKHKRWYFFDQTRMASCVETPPAPLPDARLLKLANGTCTNPEGVPIELLEATDRYIKFASQNNTMELTAIASIHCQREDQPKHGTFMYALHCWLYGANHMNFHYVAARYLGFEIVLPD